MSYDHTTALKNVEILRTEQATLVDELIAEMAAESDITVTPAQRKLVLDSMCNEVFNGWGQTTPNARIQWALAMIDLVQAAEQAGFEAGAADVANRMVEG